MDAKPVARPPIVSQEEWDEARAALLEREAAVAAAMHDLGAARKRVPMVRVERPRITGATICSRGSPGP
jgi:predicted dithiol-disulfide oxidoreductase (DUF899 family)